MPTIQIFRNPLNASDKETVDMREGQRVIDYLTENYPNGCGGSVRFLINGREHTLDDLDYLPKDDDVITLIICPAGIETILISIAVSMVLTAISYGLQMLFKKPEPPAFARPDLGETSPVYSVRMSQNSARLGAPVPVVYGSVLHTPDLCAQPYRFSYGPQDEYADMLLCIGMGEFQVDEVLLGDTPVQNLDPGTMWYSVIRPVTHQQRMGNIAPALNWTPPFYENMFVSPEVGEQEFVNLNDTAGWFRLGKAGQKGSNLFFDVLWPQGLYQMMDQGDITATSVTVRCSFVETDEDGTIISAPVDQDYQVTTTAAGRNPARLTIAVPTGKSSYWAARMSRTTVAEPNGNEVNRWIWTGLRMWVDATDQPVYGNSTLLAVRIHATKMAAEAERLIKVRLRRSLPKLGQGPGVITNDPADAFVDIMINPDYGAQRPLSEVDTQRLAQLSQYWQSGGYNYSFNAVYTNRSTVWEALTQCLTPLAAAPLPLGGFMSAAQDGIKSSRTMLFTEQNIAQDTFKLSYSFDDLGAPDGVEIEYRDPVTFAPAYVKTPSISVDPDRVVLFGCTDKTHATQYAKLMWQRRGGNRRTLSFDTEMEGLIPTLGDRVAVQHTLPRWGQSGFVVGVEQDRVTITLDRNLKWADVTGPYFMAFRSDTGGISNVVEVVRGAADDVAVLLSDPWSGTSGGWALSLREEITHFTWGDGSRVLKDFILTSLSPQSSSLITINGVYYDPSVYDDTLAFLINPVP